MHHHLARRWLAGSIFGTGRRRKLCRAARRLWGARLEAARRAGHITALHVEIGRALLRRLGVEGQLDPSHETVAGDAACSARTVRRALARLAALGLVAWQRRLVRAGWRVEQTSNAYELTEGRPFAPRPRRISTGGQAGRETRSRFIQETVPPVSVAVQRAAQASLAAVAERMQASLRAAWQAKRGAAVAS